MQNVSSQPGIMKFCNTTICVVNLAAIDKGRLLKVTIAGIL